MLFSRQKQRGFIKEEKKNNKAFIFFVVCALLTMFFVFLYSEIPEVINITNKIGSLQYRSLQPRIPGTGGTTPILPLPPTPGFPGWNQQEFLDRLVFMLKQMNEAKSQKFMITLLKMFTLPIMYISYLMNYMLINFSTGGINQLIFGGQEWNIQNIPLAFWVVIVSVPLILVIIFLFQIISMVNMDDKRTVGMRLREASLASVKIVIYIFAIPVGFFVLGTALNIGIEYISFMVNKNGNDKYFAITDNLYKLLFFGAPIIQSGDFFARYHILNILLGAGSLPGSGGPAILKPVIKAFLSWGFVGMAAAIPTLIFILGIFVSVLEKTFWLFFTFITCIYYACASAFDGGTRFNQTREKIIAKTISIAVIMLGINLVTTVAAGMKGLIAYPPATGQVGTIIQPLISSIITIAVLMGIKKIAAEVESSIGENSNYSRIGSNTRANAQTASRLGSSVVKGGAFRGPGGAAKGVASNVIGGVA
ncbi:Mbov_0396 family ICE element transmembrane protein [Williamsoniiplasma lucivorax]|uniref:Uncharacterized protein n=1 Tax=Williamsoniiplasma lucivorax TaxID=209274 RepID=A0A2S5RFG9_9MOLU|nr:hypothetical protein [Williamsoniiplasma lucivorax]PPE05962.1 hypothetical protein ELUCI_v1c02530 [Williamsoniiplasma lucivorax]